MLSLWSLILPLIGYLAVALIITWTAAAYQRWRSRGLHRPAQHIERFSTKETK